MTWKISAVVFAFSAFSGAATDSASFSDAHIHPLPKVSHRMLPRAAGLVSGTFSQTLDHFGGPTGQTFEQRYWYDSEFASGPDAPVIYHICGEMDVDQSYFLNDSANVWAKKLGARLVYLEHRYYGKSLPFPDLASDHMQYLTLQNAIEDLATFQKWISTQQGWTGKWISVGGSYSGTLSAIYRQQHPELVSGALASSAPMIGGVGRYIDDPDDLEDLSSTDPSLAPGDRQWAYEACTSVAFWEADGPEPGSNLQNPSSTLCQQLFGNIALIDPKVYNQNYDQPFLANASCSPSKIFFTYGSDDIWTTLGLSQQTNTNPGITISVIDGAGHHFDLNPPDPSDSSAVVTARSQFLGLAEQWLQTGTSR